MGSQCPWNSWPIFSRINKIGESRNVTGTSRSRVGISCVFGAIHTESALFRAAFARSCEILAMFGDGDCHLPLAANAELVIRHTVSGWVSNNGNGMSLANREVSKVSKVAA